MFASKSNPARKSLSGRFRDLSKIGQALVGTATAIAAIAGAVTAVIAVKDWLLPSHPPVLSIERTPVLGMQFWQNNSLASMSYAPKGGTDLVIVTLKKAPFEIWFPAVSAATAYEVNVSRGGSGFNIAEGAPARSDPAFAPGHGFANYEYGNGTLYLALNGENYLIGSRTQPAPGNMEKVYVSTIYDVAHNGAMPISALSGNLYLTVYIDKKGDKRFDLGDYEYVILSFS